MSGPYTIESTTRQVIERKLLTTLNDDSVVAILASKQDLEDMIYALSVAEGSGQGGIRRLALAAGMSQLLREAFPK